MTTELEPTGSAAVLPMMTREEAREAAGRIRLSLGDLRRLCAEFEARRGYRALGYENMRLCAEHEFGWSKPTFYRQLKTIEVDRSLGVSIGDTPESHARELARLPATERRDAYAASGENGKRTAADVRAEVERRRRPEPTLPVAPAPAADTAEIGLIDAAWLRDNGLTVAAALGIVRRVVELAAGPANNNRAMAARALLREARE